MNRMRFPIAVVLSLAVASAAKDNGRIIGGSLTTIYEYPDMVALLRGSVFYHQDCGGVILNNRAVLSAAHCVGAWGIHARRIRVGSSYANNGGTVITTERLIVHPEYNIPTGHNNDIGILWTTEEIPVTAASRPAWIAGPNYHVADDQEVWAAGWGRTIANDGGSVSEQLQHVKIWTVNQETCRLRYLQRSPIPNFITENMLCAGWIDVGGRDQCQGDSGGPLYHNGVVVGITSWGEGCADPFFPGVNVRVSQYTSWIDSNR